MKLIEIKKPKRGNAAWKIEELIKSLSYFWKKFNHQGIKIESNFGLNLVFSVEHDIHKLNRDAFFEYFSDFVEPDDTFYQDHGSTRWNLVFYFNKKLSTYEIEILNDSLEFLT